MVPDSEQDDVSREAMASYEADKLTGRMAATRTAGMSAATTLVAAIASEIGPRATGQERIRATLRDQLTDYRTTLCVGDVG